MMIESLVNQNWDPFIEEMVAKARQPQDKLKQERTQISDKVSELDTLKKHLTELQDSAKELQKAGNFKSRSVEVSEEDQKTIAATAGASTFTGVYAIEVLGLATRSTRNGKDGISNKLAETSDVSELTIEGLTLATGVKEGHFTINGQRITIQRTDSLQDVFSRIETETGSNVTASYNPDTDKVTLQSTNGALQIGTPADTSNFLQAFKLYADGSNQVSSNFSLGTVQLDKGLDNANLKTVPIDAGSFTINGHAFDYSSTDTISSLISQINSSDAGVYMSYRTHENRFVLQNKETGSFDVSVSDDSGNFLESLGLSTTDSTFNQGLNARFKINNGTESISTSNDVTSVSHGISGLQITLKKEGQASFFVNANPETAKEKLQEFVKKFNEVQSYLAEKTRIDPKTGKSGPFSNNQEIKNIVRSLRSNVFKVVGSEDAQFKRLADVGIDFTLQSNQLKLDEKKVLEVFSKDSEKASNIFTDAEEGFGKRLESFIETFNDKNLKTVKTSYEAQKKQLTRKIDSLEQQLLIQENGWRKTFDKLQEMNSQMYSQMQMLTSFLKL